MKFVKLLLLTILMFFATTLGVRCLVEYGPIMWIPIFIFYVIYSLFFMWIFTETNPKSEKFIILCTLISVILCIGSSVLIYKCSNMIFSKNEALIENLENQPNKPIINNNLLPSYKFNDMKKKQIAYWEKEYKPLPKNDEKVKEVYYTYIFPQGMTDFSDDLGGKLDKCSVEVTTPLDSNKKVDGKLSVDKKKGKINFKPSRPVNQKVEVQVDADIIDQRKEVRVNLNNWDKTMKELTSEYGDFEITGAKKVNSNGDYILQVKP